MAHPTWSTLKTAHQLEAAGVGVSHGTALDWMQSTLLLSLEMGTLGPSQPVASKSSRLAGGRTARKGWGLEYTTLVVTDPKVPMRPLTASKWRMDVATTFMMKQSSPVTW